MNGSGSEWTMRGTMVLALLASGATLMAAHVLVSEVLTPLSAGSVCADPAPGRGLTPCLEATTADWWLAYAVLFPGAWRGLTLLGLAWVGWAAIGLIASGLVIQGARLRPAIVLLGGAALGTCGTLGVVEIILRDTAPHDAPGQLTYAAAWALGGTLLFTLAAWLRWREPDPPLGLTQPARRV
jgi:hypothetical protein